MTQLKVLKTMGLAVHLYTLIQAVIFLFIDHNFEVLILMFTIPQFILFYQGRKLNSYFAFSVASSSEILDDNYNTTPQEEVKYGGNIESKSFRPLRFWSLIFGFLFMLIGFILIFNHFDFYGFTNYSIWILLKAIRNISIFLGGGCSVIYALAIKFFRVR
jgi:hypothetical protein